MVFLSTPNDCRQSWIFLQATSSGWPQMGMGMALLLYCGTLTDDDCKDWPARRLEYCSDAET
jgi:hypothetical protein